MAGGGVACSSGYGQNECPGWLGWGTIWTRPGLDVRTSYDSAAEGYAARLSAELERKPLELSGELPSDLLDEAAYKKVAGA